MSCFCELVSSRKELCELSISFRCLTVYLTKTNITLLSAVFTHKLRLLYLFIYPFIYLSSTGVAKNTHNNHNLWDLFRVRVRVSGRDLKIIKWIYATKVDICDKSGYMRQKWIYATKVDRWDNPYYLKWLYATKVDQWDRVKFKVDQ